MITGYNVKTLEITIIDSNDAFLDQAILDVEFPTQHTFVTATDKAAIANPAAFIVTAVANEIIDFENPPYTVVGDINGQDSWAQTALHIAGSLDINATSPIFGSQDVKYNSSTSGITHYRRPVTSSSGAEYVAKWIFVNSANLGATDEFRVAMANSADTDGARAWVCKVRGNGDVILTDDSGDTTFTGVATVGKEISYRVQVSAAGVLKFYIDRVLQLTGLRITGNQTIDRWLVSAGPNSTNNADTGRLETLSYSAPTAVVKKKFIQVVLNPNTINLDQTTKIEIQLKNGDGSNHLAAVAVTLRTSQGFITPSSITTNSSGFSDEAIFKPTRISGTIRIGATAVGFFQEFGSEEPLLTLNTPTTTGEQQWLESGDIKDHAITDDKTAANTTTKTPSGVNQFSFIKKARLVQSFDIGMDRNVNTVVVDDVGFVYVNGFDGPGATNPIVRKIDKIDGSTVADFAIPVSEENLANRFDGMTYDGAFIWVAGANHLIKIDALTMLLGTDFLIAADGNLQFVRWDGNFINFQLRGGTDTDKDKIWRLNPDDGTPVASATRVDYRAGDPVSPTIPREIKQISIDEDFIYVVGTGVATDWDRMDIVTNALVHRAGSNGTFGVALSNIRHHIFVSGGTGGGSADLLLDDTDNPGTDIGFSNSIDTNLFDGLFDGKHLWLITGTTTRQFVRKILHDPIAKTLTLVQTFDLGTSLDPTSLAFDGQHLYVASFGTTPNNKLFKIFVGK